MNPFNSLNPGNPMSDANMNYYRKIYQMLSNGGNPINMMNQIATSNPNMKPILDLLNKGANPKDIFDDLCRQRGINPNEFIKSLTK